MERRQFCVYKNILGYASEPSIELKTIKLLETIKKIGSYLTSRS